MSLTASQMQPIVLTDPALCTAMRLFALRQGFSADKVLRVAVEMFLEGAGIQPPILEASDGPRKFAADRHAESVLHLLALAPLGLQARQIETHFTWSPCTCTKACQILMTRGHVERTQVKGTKGPWPYVYRLTEAGRAAAGVQS